MTLKLKKYYLLILIFVACFVMFYSSLTAFYTNDDFYFLKISGYPGDWFNNDFQMFRPLTTQVYYYIAIRFFNLSPIPLHIISFAFLFGIIYLIYKLSNKLFDNDKVSLTAAFLYATSATHFAHLYYLATFQELGMTFFVLLSCISFANGNKTRSLLYFILGLLSKETAVVTPLLLGLIYLYQHNLLFKKFDLKKLLSAILPFAICLFVYLFIRFTLYGFAQGDSYLWDFSIKKLVNTLGWYILWSFNLPESLVDFVEPGMKINPNLWLYWSKQIVPILILFIVQTCYIVFLVFKTGILKQKSTFLLCIFWFIISLLPVAFLPIHKFSFYLTTPLIGLVILIAYLFLKTKISNLALTGFLIIWTTLSLLTLKYSQNTSWITQGEKVAYRVYSFFNQYKSSFIISGIKFIDTNEDGDLPWSPTEAVKVALSGRNFFDIYFPEINGKVFYGNGEGLPVISRQFLGY